MGSLKALLIAGAVATGAASAASAADLPPPPQLAPTIVPEPEFSGWYIRGDVGVGHATLEKFEQTFNTPIPGFQVEESHLDDSAFADGGIGYQFNSWLRFDVTGEYRTSQRFQAIESFALIGVPDNNGNPNSRGFDTYNGSVQSSVVLANAYFDIGHWYGFTPYIGGGAGVAFNRVASLTDIGAGSTAFNAAGNGGLGFAAEHSSTSFAWAAMAGLSYDITPNVKLDLGYRHLNMGTAQSAPIVCTINNGCPLERHKYTLASDDIRVGLRWMFNAPQPAPVVYEPPIVRKY